MSIESNRVSQPLTLTLKVGNGNIRENRLYETDKQTYILFSVQNRPYQYDLKEIQKHFFIIVSKDPIVTCVSGCTFVTENTSLFLKVLGGY